MDRTFVVESCEIVGIARFPLTPRIVFPDRMFPATQSVTPDRETVPPLVYPAGIVTVPATVEIVPLVEPLFAIDPEIDPDAPNAVLLVSTSPADMSAVLVS